MTVYVFVLFYRLIKGLFMDFEPDVDVAKKYVKLVEFSTYSMAYVITNEDLRQSMQFVPKNCNRALVTAASGDHPLFCSLYGARQVDTFDISYNAKCIMDIKTAALKCMGHVAYIELLKNLHLCQNIQHVPNMEYISKIIPKTEWEYLYALGGCHIFRKGSNPERYKGHFPTKQEYKKLCEVVKKPYNFMLADIDSLSAHLTQKYDFIHLSNILDHLPIHRHINIITPLLDYVNVGGRILMLDEFQLNSMKENGISVGPSCEEACKNIVRIYNDWRFVRNETHFINVLERFR